MNKETGLSILRSVLTAVGAYLMGKFFLGSTIDNNLWGGIAAAVVTSVSIVWGFVDKSINAEKLESGLRSVIITFGTLLVGSGVIKSEVLDSVLAVISLLIPVLLSQAAKSGNKSVATGEVKIADLSGVNPAKVQITPDTNPVQTKDQKPLN